MIFLLALIFWVTMQIGRKSANVLGIFPEVNCDVIERTYGKKLEQYAIEDMETILAWKDNLYREKIKTRGCIECFCA